MHAEDEGPLQTQATGETVMRYHLRWKHRDLDGVMALYHPEVQYSDFFQNRVMGLDELRDYVQGSMPRDPDEALEHSDRIRVDGDTAFIQYRITLHGGEGLVSFRASEAITVKDGLIWRVNEYAALVHDQPTGQSAGTPRLAVSRLGLSPRQLGFMADDLQQYFQRQQPYLDPGLDLQRVAQACGYSRNQISYLLNQVLGQSFYRYVNQARPATPAQDAGQCFVASACRRVGVRRRFQFTVGLLQLFSPAHRPVAQGLPQTNLLACTRARQRLSRRTSIQAIEI